MFLAAKDAGQKKRGERCVLCAMVSALCALVGCSALHVGLLPLLW